MTRVWETQGVDADLCAAFLGSARAVQGALLELPSGSTNVGEWAKKEACWQKVLQLRLSLGTAAEEWTIDQGESRGEQAQGRRDGARDDGIELQRAVFALSGNGYWAALYGWEKLHDFVFGPDLRLLAKASTQQGCTRIALDRDWRKLIAIRDRCEGEGFRFSPK